MSASSIPLTVVPFDTQTLYLSGDYSPVSLGDLSNLIVGSSVDVIPISVTLGDTVLGTNASILVQDGSTLEIDGPMTSEPGGNIQVGLNSNLIIGSGIGSTDIPISFTSTGGSITIEDGVDPIILNSITGIGNGNTVDIPNIPDASIFVGSDGSVSLLSGGIAVALLNLASGVDPSTLELQSDGQGGVQIGTDLADSALLLNVLSSTTIDRSGTYGVASVAAGSTLTVTKDADTPSGDPVVVNFETLDANVLSTIAVTNGATLVLDALAGVQALTNFQIGSDSTLEFSSALNVSLVNPISFTGTGGTLILDTPIDLSLLSTVDGLSGNSIDFRDISAATSAQASNGILTVYNGTTVVAAMLLGDGFSNTNLSLTSDNQGGFVVSGISASTGGTDSGSGGSGGTSSGGTDNGSGGTGGTSSGGTDNGSGGTSTGGTTSGGTDNGSGGTGGASSGGTDNGSGGTSTGGTTSGGTDSGSDGSGSTSSGGTDNGSSGTNTGGTSSGGTDTGSSGTSSGGTDTSTSTGTSGTGSTDGSSTNTNGTTSTSPGVVVVTGAHGAYVLAKNPSGDLYLQGPSDPQYGGQILNDAIQVNFADGTGYFDSTGNAEDVAHIYQTALGRDPDLVGLNYWTTNLNAGNISDLGVADFFASSNEFLSHYGNLSNQDFVAQLYENVLGRQGETEGETFWTNVLNQGQSRGYVVLGFATSPENIQNTLSFTGDKNESESYRLYQAALDRTPDQDGLNFWTKQMENGASASSIAQGFIDSSEFSKVYGGLNNSDFVSLLYQNTLNRQGDSAGQSFWTNQLNNGASRADVLLGFSDSLENRINTTAATHADWVYLNGQH